MFVHTWIVTESEDEINRFDVFGFKIERGERNGYVYKNFNPPFLGCPIFSIGKYRFLQNRYRWKTKILYSFEGEAGSDAEKVCTFLSQNYTNLPFTQKYRLLFGPNSNSFTQWVLDKIALNTYPLPRSAYGRGWNGGTKSN